MRLPNGYGSVSKQSGNRRDPYVVKKTVGYNAKGYPIYKIIGYTPTREAGLALLAKYNENPWNLDSQNMTMKELFEMWQKTRARKLSEASAKSLVTAFKHCAEIHHLQYRNIKAFQMQQMIDAHPESPSIQSKIKSLFHHLDKMALELDIPSKGYSGIITAAPIQPGERRPFSEAEIQTVWGHWQEPWADTVLIMLYSGWRISELLSLRKDDISLSAGTMRGGTKTAAGKDRVVPIHPRIMPLVQARMKLPGDRLVNIGMTPYRKHWKKLMDAWGMDHTPHECRHTFRTRLDNAGANKKCCDLLMGHASTDTGLRVYTHKTLNELRAAVELLD